MNLCLLRSRGVGWGVENYHHLKSGKWFSSPCSAATSQPLTSPTPLSAQTRHLGSIIAFAVSSSSSMCVSQDYPEKQNQLEKQIYMRMKPLV